LNLNLTATINLKGNVSVASGSTLTFSPTAASQLLLNGTSQQTISGSGALTIGTNVGMTLNNTGGFGLQRPVTIQGSINFMAGIVSTTATNLLTFASTASVSGGSTVAYVSGPLAHTIASTSSATKVFPVGKSAYRPVEVTITQDAATSTIYTAECFDGAPPARTMPSTLDHVSVIRYFAIAKGTGANVTTGAVKLNYDADDCVTDYAYLRLAGEDGTNWIDDGGAGTANTTGSITSTSNVTAFGLFTLGNAVGGTNPLPVQLGAFRADRRAAGVRLFWQTVSEYNNREFVIERRIDTDEPWMRIGSIAGHGSSDLRHDYTFDDPTAGALLTAHDLTYRLRQIDRDGTFSLSGIVTVRGAGRAVLALSQNQPNPFNTQTTIGFRIPAAQHVMMTVHDLTGREVSRVIDCVFPAGEHRVSYDAGALPSGLYFYRITTGSGSIVRSMTLDR
jgi:trimeric autotransporter adhesin